MTSKNRYTIKWDGKSFAANAKTITDKEAKRLWSQCTHDWSMGAYTAMADKLAQREDLGDE